MKRIPLILLLLLFVLSPLYTYADEFDQLRKDAAGIKTVQAGFFMPHRILSAGNT